MILKLLLIIVVIATVYFLFIKKKPIRNTSKKSDTKNKNKDETKQQSNEMIECTTCGIYCELDDTIISNGKYYCSTECLEKE